MTVGSKKLGSQTPSSNKGGPSNAPTESPTETAASRAVAERAAEEARQSLLREQEAEEAQEKKRIKRNTRRKEARAKEKAKTDSQKGEVPHSAPPSPTPSLMQSEGKEDFNPEAQGKNTQEQTELMDRTGWTTVKGKGRSEVQAGDGGAPPTSERDSRNDSSRFPHPFSPPSSLPPSATSAMRRQAPKYRVPPPGATANDVDLTVLPMSTDRTPSQWPPVQSLMSGGSEPETVQPDEPDA